MKLSGVVLAAGSSRRLGHPKQLVPFRGRPLLRSVTETVCQSTCGEVAVVLGARGKEILPAIGDLPVKALENPAWEEGIASSVRAGVRWAMENGSDGVLLTVCDQPYLTVAHLDQLTGIWRGTGGAVASHYSGIMGTPAIFSAADFPRLLALEGAKGACSVLRATQVTCVEWPEGAIDLDTPEDAAALAASQR